MTRGMYVGYTGNVPTYTSQNTNVTITASNISQYFSVSNDSYYFAGSGGTFTSNNKSDNSTSTSTWVAKVDMTAISFSYSVSSESNYDKLTIKVGNTTVANAISGSVSSTWSGAISKGQAVVLTYSKDVSQASGSDCGTISNIVITQTVTVQSGTKPVTNVAMPILKGYVGVYGEAPVYEEQTATQNVTTDITASNLSTYFTVSNSSYYFAGNGSTFTSNNNGRSSTSATSTWTAKKAMTVSFDYSVSSESSYDKLTIKVGSTTVASAISGTQSSSWSGSLAAGAAITLTYSKDGSVNTSPDCGTISNLKVTQSETITTQVQTGTEIRDVARRIIKAYIGVNGLAKACYTRREIGINLYEPDQTVELSVGRGYTIGAATAGNSYAVFAGGSVPYGSADVGVVDAFSSSFTRTTLASLGADRYFIDGQGIGDYAIIAGGGRYTQETIVNTVIAYNTSLSKTTCTSLPTTRKVDCKQSAAIGNYAVFGGGTTYDTSTAISNVTAYNKSLSRTTATALSQARNDVPAASNSKYAIFGGGYPDYDTYNAFFSSVVDAYNSSLSRTVPAALTTARNSGGAGRAGDYVLFVSGWTGMEGLASVEAYDSSLTKTTAPDLSSVVSGASTATVNDHLIVVCDNIADVYNASLTKTTTQPLTVLRGVGASVTIGEYAMFAGGTYGSNYYPTIDIYYYYSGE